jgi:succinate dehydrogenase / fumarate reductase cytochrome b subunit
MRKIPFSSSTATKLLIALTGLGLYFFLITHVAGNMLVLAGKETFNNYSHVLGGNPAILFIELGLLAVFLVHVVKTATNAIANRAKRPVSYVKKRLAGGASKKTVASSTMIVTGTILLVFIVLHLFHFKFAAMELVPGTHVKDLHGQEMQLFSNPAVVAFYVVSMVVVGFHLWHGFWSALQSLGLGSSKYTPWFRAVGKFLAIGITGGFIFLPVWVYLVGSRQ